MENFVSEKVSEAAANDDEEQKSIIWTTSNKLTGNLLWSSSVKQLKAFQPRFCSTPAAVGMKHNVDSVKEMKKGYRQEERRKNKRMASFSLVINSFTFVGVTSVQVFTSEAQVSFVLGMRELAFKPTLEQG
jgi:hypothetical protein